MDGVALSLGAALRDEPRVRAQAGEGGDHGHDGEPAVMTPNYSGGGIRG